MVYDLHGSWDPKTGAATSLPEAITAVNIFLQAGTPPDKIVLGMSSYGRSWTLTDATKNTPGSDASGAGSPGPYTKEAGFLSYYEILQLGVTPTYDPATSTFYTVSGNQYISHETPRSLAEKVDYIIRNKFAGAMFWALDLDDYQNGYPLISSVSQRLYTPQTQAARLSVKLPPATSDFDPVSFQQALSSQFGLDNQAFRILTAARNPDSNAITVDVSVVETFTDSSGNPAAPAHVSLQALMSAGSVNVQGYQATVVNGGKSADTALTLVLPLVLGLGGGILLAVSVTFIVIYYRKRSTGVSTRKPPTGDSMQL
jgi:hypothetical protein